MRRRRGLISTLVIGALLCAPALADGATITVTTTDDMIAEDGACSLREAVLAANTDAATGGCAAGSGVDTIMVPAGKYRLTKTGNEEDSFNGLANDATVRDLDLKAPVSIQGASAAATIIDAAGTGRAIDTYAPAELHHLTITGGRALTTLIPHSADGGGVRSGLALVVDDCVFIDNHAGDGLPGAASIGAPGGGLAIGGSGDAGGGGGAIYAFAGLKVTNSRFEHNSAGTGGVSGDATGGAGTLSNTSTTVIHGGGALAGGAGDGGDGGAVWAAGGASVAGSTFLDNSAGAGGRGGNSTGGLGNFYLSASINTVAGDGGGAQSGLGGHGGDGGALYVSTSAGQVTQSTFTANHAGNGGAAGTATGGAGVTASSLVFAAIGNGGVAIGLAGGAGGNGGAIATQAASGILDLSAATFAGNASGIGGSGGAAVAGNGGYILDTFQGFAGAATAGAGGVGGNGGAVAVAGGATIVNVTITGNTTAAGGGGGGATAATLGHPASVPATGGAGGASGMGGAVANLAANTDALIRNATLTDNGYGAAGAGGAPGGAAGAVPGGSAVARLDGTVRLAASIIAGNTVGACIAAPSAITDAGSNLRFPANDASCPGSVGDPALTPLRDNGGPVTTQAPSAASPAIDAAPTGTCASSDARGAARPFGKGCDIGAYELTPPSAATGPAKDIKAAGGTLTATIDPHGPPANARFEYGKTDDYGSKTQAQDLGAGFGTRPASAAISGFPVGTVIHYRVVVTTPDGIATGADARFTTGATGSSTGGGAGSRAADKIAPKLTKVSLSAKRFAVAPKPATVQPRGKHTTASGIPIGATVRFKLSEKATVRLAITQPVVTRKKGKKITRQITRGTVQRAFKPGSRSLWFSGWIGRKALPPGTYKVSVRAADAAKNHSKAITFTIKIVKPARGAK